MKKVKKIAIISFGVIVILWGISVAIGVSKYGSWDAYWSNIHSKSEKKRLLEAQEEKEEKSDECCCCFPYEGQIGTCAETKRMSKKKCESKGGHPLLDDEKCN